MFTILNRMDMLQVRGKCNRRVPILITPECQRSMEILQKSRSVQGIPETNYYFFASRGNGHIDAWQTIHKTAQEAGGRVYDMHQTQEILFHSCTGICICFYPCPLISPPHAAVGG